MNLVAAALHRPPPSPRGLATTAVLAAALSVPLTHTGAAIEAAHAPPQVRVAAVLGASSALAMGKLDV